MDEKGDVLATFTDVDEPRHLSTDSEGHVLVADNCNHRILLLNPQLQLLRLLVDSKSQAKLLHPRLLSYNELTSHVCVVHFDTMSVLTLR